VIVTAAAPLIAPHDPNTQDLSKSFGDPTWSHLLGTDRFGRDILSRLMYAGWVTVKAGVLGLGVGVVLGVPIGLVAGYVRGPLDAVMSRISDTLQSLPTLILALAIVGSLGRGITNAMLAVGITLAPRFFRVARSAAQSVTVEGYMEAARADGCSSWRLLWRHVLPNANGPLLVQVSFGIGQVIIAEAGLSFLGLGVQPPDASWGSMMREGFSSIRLEQYTVFPPSIAVTLTIMACFLAGDGLRDALGRAR
jgi:peptide/nickel transport system permease protein